MTSKIIIDTGFSKEEIEINQEILSIIKLSVLAENQELIQDKIKQIINKHKITIDEKDCDNCMHFCDYCELECDYPDLKHWQGSNIDAQKILKDLEELVG